MTPIYIDVCADVTAELAGEAPAEPQAAAGRSSALQKPCLPVVSQTCIEKDDVHYRLFRYNATLP